MTILLVFLFKGEDFLPEYPNDKFDTVIQNQVYMNREGKSEWIDDVKLDYWQDEWTTNYLQIRYNDECIEVTEEDDSDDYGGSGYYK